ncbi:hypothetical protein [Humibacter ginsenosidimutans]|uniref:Uncharacterized protein n=1 Tax=Humibacter ginsenosidimutans TaxID=2599293 RepID=A0A5B8M1Z2_9MICO|nr:hypothetical protein [Humibacter ginsenosidimutans]QDZ14768.1 hypothetical protein FPZ11_08355 [Humibacter ginsenosidimutans]
MPNPSPIKLDCSAALIVIYCTEHPWWRASRFVKDDAWDAACAHEEREHTGDDRQRHARTVRQERARHAAHS